MHKFKVIILFRRPARQLRRRGYLCCCQSIKLVDGKKKITGNTVKVDEACARSMFRSFSDTKSLEVNKEVIKTALMISEFTEHIGLDNMRSSCSLEVVDSRRLSNLPTAQKTPHTRLGHHIQHQHQHRILLEVDDSLVVADCWMQVVPTIPDGAKAGC